MTLAPVNAQAAMTQSLVQMKQTLMDLQTQLGTGKRAQTYGGLGPDASLSLVLRGRLSAMDGYASTSQTVGVRLSLLQTTLTQFGSLGTEAQQDAANTLVSGDATTAAGAQARAQSRLAEAVGMLNTDIAGRHLLAGAAVDQAPVQDTNLLLDGDGTHAGLRQIVAERRAADLGASGLGRLAVTAPTATSVTVSEDGVHPFGFKLAGVTVPASGAVTATAPAGSPPATTIDFTAQPADGDAVSLTLNLPDGSQEQVQLTARASASADNDTFQIGATAADTAANFQTALTTALQSRASGALAAASELKAADDFFVSGGAAPQRVVGPPFDSATALTAGTSANTVLWYQGDDGSGNPRTTATAEVAQGIVAAYGVRADETPFARTMASMAALAADSFSSSDPSAVARYQALASRIQNRLDANGPASVTGIEMDITTAQQTLQSADDRRQTESNTAQNLLDGVENATPEEVASRILAVQTQLEASYQTTAMLAHLSLVNYLGVTGG